MKKGRPRPEKIRIKVISAGKPTYWYSNKIGKEYDVYSGVTDEDRALTGEDYVDAEDYELGAELWHQLRPSDCEIVSQHIIK